LYLYTAENRTRRQKQRATRQDPGQSADDQARPPQAAMVLFYSLLDEQPRRLYAGMESL
jgi:hypothetical protein